MTPHRITNGPIRAAFILPSFAGGGAERVTLTFLRHLNRDRITPHLVVLTAEGPLQDLVPNDISVTDLGKPRLRQALGPLRRTLSELRPHVIYASIGYTNLALIALRPFLRGRPSVVVREANMPSLSVPQSPWPHLYAMAYRTLYKRADCVIATSQCMAEELRDDFGVPISRLAVAPNPVDEAHLRKAATPPQRRPGPGLRLAAAGRLTWQKGFDRLIPLLAALPEESHLTIFGDGPLRSSLEEAARTAGVAHRLSLPGFTHDLPAHLAGADAFLLPSRWEGLPNVALEALAVGTPVIATPEAGAIAEIAAAAPPRAVMIAPAGSAFTATVSTWAENQDHGFEKEERLDTPRASLMPGINRMQQAVRTMEDVLAASVQPERVQDQ